MTSPASVHPLTNDDVLRRRLVALAGRWLGRADEAEEMVQEAWLRTAHGNLPATADSRERWLVAVLRNLCVDAWRRQRRYRDVLEQLAGHEGGDREAPSPEHLIEQAQGVEQALRRLVASLPPGEVAAVVLYEVFGFSHAELGVLTGRSEAASRQQVHRMLRRVRTGPAAHAAADDEANCLLALCRAALAQRDPAALVALLRLASPQALALSAQADGCGAGEAALPPVAGVVQIGKQMVVQFRTADGTIAITPVGQAYAEAA